MSADKYAALDAAIVQRIASGSDTFASVFAREVLDAARDLDGKHANFRAVDRRLQALRKAGRIAWTRAEGWTISAQTGEAGK